MLILFLKATGAVLVLFAGGAFGWVRGEAAMRRCRCLEEMHDFLDAARSNLHYRCDKTKDLLTQAAYGTLRTMTLPLEQIQDGPELQETLKEALHAMFNAAGVLQEEEWQIFCSALAGLGTMPAEQEEQHLAYAAAQMNELSKNVRREALQKQKLYRTAGVSLGAAAALLLV